VIHIDTAEAELEGFDVKRPDRRADGYGGRGAERCRGVGAQRAHHRG